MFSKTIASCLVFICVSCKNGNSQLAKAYEYKSTAIVTDTMATENLYATIGQIPPPAGYTRPLSEKNSFAKWLSGVRLKKNKTVYLFDGSIKPFQDAQFAVLDIPVGKKDLQQCADAVMRLRATYLYDQGKFEAIVFVDNEGRSYRFSAPHNSKRFDSYLQTVFGMCGTASLAKQLKKVDLREIQPGDVFIRGGFPGHAVIVMDVVSNEAGVKQYMLAQSYMPAQDIHVLVNPGDKDLSPWYIVSDESLIETPEYSFHSNELMRW